MRLHPVCVEASSKWAAAWAASLDLSGNYLLVDNCFVEPDRTSCSPSRLGLIDIRGGQTATGSLAEDSD